MAAPVVISGGRAVGVTTAPYAALREAVTEVTRALEDAAWTNLSEDRRRDDLPYEERKALIQRSRRFCRRHPLAKQATKLLVNYCLGNGVTLRANDKGKVARLVDEFWENPVNQEVFTGHAAMSDAMKGTFSDGDLFLVLFPDKEQGTLELGTIDATFVEDIIGDKDNWKVPKWYKVKKPAGHYDFTSGQWIAEGGADFVWYRDWHNEDDLPKDEESAEADPLEAEVKPKRKRGKARQNFDRPTKVEDGLVYHVAINRRGLFGEPETAAALDWLKAHKEFMEDRATINRAASTIAWKKKQKGTVASVQATAAALRSQLTAAQAGWDSNPPPSTGSTVIENDNSSTEWMRTDTGGSAALADERILRMMVGSGMGGIPNHIFGDEAAANLATATAMGTPMHKSYEQWQKLLSTIIKDLLDFMLETAHNAGRIGERDDSSKYKDAKEKNAKKVIDDEGSGPKNLTSGPQPKQLGTGAKVAEHGDTADPEYEAKYHPGPGGEQSTVDTGEPADSTYSKYYLDDGRWDPERIEMHDAYVRDVQAGKYSEGGPVPTVANPTVQLMGGGTASGKSTAIKSGTIEGVTKEGVAVVNADDAKSRLDEYKEMIAKRDKKAAGVVHGESSDMSKRALFESIHNGHNVLYDAVGDNGIDSLSKKVQEMRDEGATAVYADYMMLPIQQGIARMKERFKKEYRWVEPAIMRLAYNDLPHTIYAASQKGIFDRMRIWDNDVDGLHGEKPILIAIQEAGGELNIVNQAGWDKYMGKVQMEESGPPPVPFGEHGDPSMVDYRARFHPGPGGTNVGEVRENPAATVIRGHEAEFRSGGGTIHVMKGYDRADEQALLMSLADMNAAMGGDWLGNLGPSFTRRAIGAHRWGEEVTIAHDDEGLAGALAWEDFDERNMHLDVLGTTGIAPGTGSALTAWALRRAASTNRGVLLEPLGSAVNFWRMMGMHPMPGGKYWGMTADEVVEVTGGLN